MFTIGGNALARQVKIRQRPPGTRETIAVSQKNKMKKSQKIGAKESRRKKKKKKGISASDIVLMLIFIVALAVAAFAGYRLYSIMMEYKAGVDEYSQIADTVVKERDADKEKIKKLKDAETGEEVKHWESPLDIDFKELKSIGRDVFSIIIPNKLFPNVKKVESKSSSYTTGKYLVEKAGMILRNAFVQSEDAAVDFTQFNRIGNYAFEGCKAKSAAGLDEMRIAMVQEAAFVNSGFLDQPFVGGIKCLGPFIIDIDETADEIVLPKSDVSFCVKKRPKKAVRVPNLNAVAALRVLPKKVIIEDEKINYDDALLYKLYSQDIEEIESHISRYKTVDGIVYSADMKT